MQFAIINLSSDPQLTQASLLLIAAACEKQLSEHFGPAWQQTPIPVGVYGAAADAPSDACLIRVLDNLTEPDALGDHYTDGLGRPVSDIGWNVIKTYGGNILQGNDALSVTISHEILEASADPYIAFWVDFDGVHEIALEVCDPVEDQSYEIDGVSVSNFVTSRYFSHGVGPYDYLGSLTAPFTKTSQGYYRLRTGGPGGTFTDVMSMTPSARQVARDAGNSRNSCR